MNFLWNRFHKNSNPITAHSIFCVPNSIFSHKIESLPIEKASVLEPRGFLRGNSKLPPNSHNNKLHPQNHHKPSQSTTNTTTTINCGVDDLHRTPRRFPSHASTSSIELRTSSTTQTPDIIDDDHRSSDKNNKAKSTTIYQIDDDYHLQRLLRLHSQGLVHFSFAVSLLGQVKRIHNNNERISGSEGRRSILY